MPRSKNKITRIPVDKRKLLCAIKHIQERNYSIRAAAKEFNLSRCTLKRNFDHYLKSFADAKEPTLLHDNLAVNQVFTKMEEDLLVVYIKEAAKLHYGLTLKDVRRLAYEFAKQNKKKYPAQWNQRKIAGESWIRLFRKRYENEVSLRKPEATSLARSTAFNRATVQATFENIKRALTKCPQIKPTDVWNVDETGNSTVHVPPKILASKGVKQVGTMTSGERGNTVTMIAAINAGGGFIPPMLIFPRVNFKDFMLAGAPVGSIGGANPSGWSNDALFLQFFKHFIDYVKPSKDRPVILLLDNHESHIQIPVIELARQNGVILVTFHPHTSHKFQPLDKTVFGPYKKYYNTAANEMMLTFGHVGKPITIYDVAALVGKAFPLAFTPSNITEGFSRTGLYPLNENIFGDSDFLPSYVTDRPLTQPENEPQEDTSCKDINTNPEFDKRQTSSEVIPGTSKQLPINDPSCSNTITPSMMRPHPKAQPRKDVRKGRQKGRSRILTDTPEKVEIEKLKSNKKQEIKKNKKIDVKKKIVKKALFNEQSDTSEDEVELFSLQDSDASEGFLPSEEESENNDFDGSKENEPPVNYAVGDYVVFIYEGEYFVGVIESVCEEGALIKSMQKSLKNWKWPEKKDQNLYQWSDIIEKVKTPKKINSKREFYSVPEMNKYWEFTN